MLLIIAILVLVVIIFRKTMREGNAECENTETCENILSRLSDKTNKGGEKYAERLYDHNTKKIYRLKHDDTEWTKRTKNNRREIRLMRNNCCSSKPLESPIGGVQTAADAAKIAVIEERTQQPTGVGGPIPAQAVGGVAAKIAVIEERTLGPTGVGGPIPAQAVGGVAAGTTIVMPVDDTVSGVVADVIQEKAKMDDGCLYSTENGEEYKGTPYCKARYKKIKRADDRLKKMEEKGRTGGLYERRKDDQENRIAKFIANGCTRYKADGSSCENGE